MIGVMFWIDIFQEGKVEQVFEVENAFIDIAYQRDYKVYLQAQNFERKVDFSRYYGKDVCQEFLKQKNKVDPDHRINRGVFFDR